MKLSIKLTWEFKFTIKWIILTVVYSSKTAQYSLKWEMLKRQWKTKDHKIKVSLKLPSFRVYKYFWIECPCGCHETHAQVNKYKMVRYWKGDRYFGVIKPCSCWG